jgi:hypothetical protein
VAAPSTTSAHCASAVRLFAGDPTRVAATRILDGDAGVDLRMAATLRLPGDVLAQFDVALDLTRRDELELVGTEGRLVVPEPWLCRASHLELSRDGRVEHVPVDPEGTLGLTDPDHDVYRVESSTRLGVARRRQAPPFGRADAGSPGRRRSGPVRSADDGTPVDLGSGLGSAAMAAEDDSTTSPVNAWQRRGAAASVHRRAQPGRSQRRLRLDAGGLTDDAQLVFEGIPVGPFRGREAIGAAYRLQPPDGELELLGVDEDGHGGASGSYAWSERPGVVAGAVHVTARGGRITRVLVRYGDDGRSRPEG